MCSHSILRRYTGYALLLPIAEFKASDSSFSHVHFCFLVCGFLYFGWFRLVFLRLANLRHFETTLLAYSKCLWSGMLLIKVDTLHFVIQMENSRPVGGR